MTGALQERCGDRVGDEVARRLQGQDWCRVRAGCRGVAAFRSDATALQRPDKVRCSVPERWRSVAEAGVGALQRPGALQERC